MNVRKIIQSSSFIILCMIIVSILIVLFNRNIGNIEILNDDFLITYMLYMLGFALTVSAILYSFIEKVYGRVNSNNYNTNKSENIKKILKLLLNELKEDTIFIFILLISLILVSLFKDIDIPKVSFYEYKCDIIYFIKIMSIFLSSYSIMDIILTVFKILGINDD